jgi:hypothetical protein
VGFPCEIREEKVFTTFMDTGTRVAFSHEAGGVSGNGCQLSSNVAALNIEPPGNFMGGAIRRSLIRGDWCKLARRSMPVGSIALGPTQSRVKTLLQYKFTYMYRARRKKVPPAGNKASVYSRHDAWCMCTDTAILTLIAKTGVHCYEVHKLACHIVMNSIGSVLITM